MRKPKISADTEMEGANLFLDPPAAPTSSKQTVQKPPSTQKPPRIQKSPKKTLVKRGNSTEAPTDKSIKGTYYLPLDVDQALRQAYSLRIQTQRGAKINDIIVEALRAYLPKLLRELGAQ